MLFPERSEVRVPFVRLCDADGDSSFCDGVSDAVRKSREIEDDFVVDGVSVCDDVASKLGCHEPVFDGVAVLAVLERVCKALGDAVKVAATVGLDVAECSLVSDG